MKHGSNTDEDRAAGRVIQGAATGRKRCQCTIRALSIEFSDPCFIRVSSVAQNRLILIRMTRGRACSPRLVLWLSGRGKVAVHDASASEFGANKPRNEANIDEAQADGGQDGKTRSLDSGGENRPNSRRACCQAWLRGRCPVARTAGLSTPVSPGRFLRIFFRPGEYTSN